MFHNTHNVSCNKWNNLPFHSFLGPFILVCSFIKEFIVLCNMCDETFKVLNAKLFPMDQFIHKVYTFWEGHTIMRNLHLTFALCSASQKYWWRFRKILWPSQNTWTLSSTVLESIWCTPHDFTHFPIQNFEFPWMRMKRILFV